MMKSFLLYTVILYGLFTLPVAHSKQFNFHAFWETKHGSAQEVVVTGVPDSEFQQAFNTFTKEGLELFLIDGYDVDGKSYLNCIFRTSTGKKWASRSGLTSQQYQKAFNKYVRDSNYDLRWVDSYRKGKSIRYAAIFTQQHNRSQKAYHGYTTHQHQNRFDKLTKNGWDPINISVVSMKGKRYYTAFYEKKKGGFVSKSFLTRDQFKTAHAKQKKKGRSLAYMNAYTHDKNKLPRFVAIWRSKIRGGKYLPNVYGPKVMDQGEELGGKGYFVRFVTGYGVGNGHRFDTLWYKPKGAVSGKSVIKKRAKRAAPKKLK